MRNNATYKRLKQIAIDGGYTIEQVEKLDFNKAAKLLGSREGLTGTLVSKAKAGIIAMLKNRNDEQAMQELKQTAKNWLDTNFPAWQSERGREGDKPYVKIWLKGKPERIEPE